MKIILLCGKICSGKSYFAEKLKEERNAVLLSCDEAYSSIFPDRHEGLLEEEMNRIKAYLYRKSLDILKTGTEVILDFGFWSKTERERINRYYEYNGIETEWHFVDVSDEVWERNIERRNRRIRKGLSKDFYLDDATLENLMSGFEKPEREEMDFWYENVDNATIE